MPEPSARDGRAALLSGRGIQTAASARRGLVRACSFLSCRLVCCSVLTPFVGFHMFFQLPTTLFLPLVYSDSNFETHPDDQHCQTAPPPQGWLSAQRAGPACVIPTELDQGRPVVPLGHARIPAVSLCAVIVNLLVCLPTGLWIP